jgi:hypothetical protein
MFLRAISHRSTKPSSNLQNGLGISTAVRSQSIVTCLHGSTNDGTHTRFVMRCKAPCADAPQSKRANPCAYKCKEDKPLVNMFAAGDIRTLGKDCIVLSMWQRPLS